MLKVIEALFFELAKAKVRNFTGNMLGKVAAFLGWMMMTFVLMVVLMFALSFIALAITFLLAEVMPLWGAALITVGLFLFTMFLLFMFRESLFIRPVRRRLLHIIDSHSEE